MLFGKKNFENLGDIDLEKLESISKFEETGKISSVKSGDLPKGSKEIYEIILKMKEKERLYNRSIMVLIVLNLFLTAVVIYLGIVKIA